MGGMGAGMGAGGPARPSVTGVVPVEQRGDDLLQGLNEASQEYRQKGTGKLKGRYKQGMGMGGMGGIGAGGAY
jgi:hypothetical protein